MRFKKGSKVEVLRKRDTPPGSWWCAEIISGNGHNYSVRYDRTPDGVMIERASRKVIRPLPPTGMSNWSLGDVVEFFDNYSWNIAKVFKVMDEDFFVVRPLGSSRDLCVHISNIRARQSWKNDQWTLVGKDSRYCEDRKVDKSLSGKYHLKSKYQLHLQNGNEGIVETYRPATENNNCLAEEPYADPSDRRCVKRGPQYWSSYISTNTGPHKRVRAIEREGSCKQWHWQHGAQKIEKVDAVASPQKMLGEKYMHASFNNRTIRYEMDAKESRTINANMGCYPVRSLEPNDSESSACSVASCDSNNYGSYNMPYICRPGPSHDSYSDDAESSSAGWENGGKSTSLSKKEVAAEIHKLELHAYRSTLEALYASGPLSWEQEEVMTNLRLNLNISNDEHLMELRHLVSAES